MEDRRRLRSLRKLSTLLSASFRLPREFSASWIMFRPLSYGTNIPDRLIIIPYNCSPVEPTNSFFSSSSSILLVFSSFSAFLLRVRKCHHVSARGRHHVPIKILSIAPYFVVLKLAVFYCCDCFYLESFMFTSNALTFLFNSMFSLVRWSSSSNRFDWLPTNSLKAEKRGGKKSA